MTAIRCGMGDGRGRVCGRRLGDVSSRQGLVPAEGVKLDLDLEPPGYIVCPRHGPLLFDWDLLVGTADSKGDDFLLVTEAYSLPDSPEFPPAKPPLPNPTPEIPIPD